MKRSVDPIYGVEGEFYVFGSGFCGQDAEDNVIDRNSPPSTQPGLWCQWKPFFDDGNFGLEWDGGEKFYYYVEWLQYIIDNFLMSRGIMLTGAISWSGEDPTDNGIINVDTNHITLVRITR